VKQENEIMIKGGTRFKRLCLSALQHIENRNMLRFYDNIILSNKTMNMSDTILISGSPRSGTNWLLEIMVTIPNYTFLFEPIQHTYYPTALTAGFKSRKYLQQNLDWSDGEEYLKKVFSGRLINHEMALRRLICNKIIVKSVNFSRLLPWINYRFKLRHIFFVIRHPCAVIASQIRTGIFGYHPYSPPCMEIFPTLENVLNEFSEIDGLDKQLFNRLKNIKTAEEILAVVWCLDNYVPLSLSKPYPWTIVIYEKLVKDGEKEIIRIFNKIGEKHIPRSAFRHLKIPSMTTMRDEVKDVINKDKQLNKWKEFLSDKQVERILKIVSDFGLDFYIDDLDPDYEDITIKN